MIPEYNKDDEVYLEHITRYHFSKQFVNDKIVLDIACGTGYGSWLLLKNGAKFVYGIDISAETIEYCNHHYKTDKIEFKLGDAGNIPLDNNSIDIVVSFETIEHLNEKSQINFFSEIKRILKRDGLLIISTPNSLVNNAENPFHLNLLSLDSLEKLIRKYFINFKIYFQKNITSNFIFTEDHLTQKEIIKSNINVLKTVNYKKEEVYFFIVLCSNVYFPKNIECVIALQNDNARGLYLDHIKQKDEIILTFKNLINEQYEIIKSLTEKVKKFQIISTIKAGLKKLIKQKLND